MPYGSVPQHLSVRASLLHGDDVLLQGIWTMCAIVWVYMQAECSLCWHAYHNAENQCIVLCCHDEDTDHV